MKKWILIISFVCGFFPYMLSSCGGAFLNSTNLFSSLPDADGESRQIPNNDFFFMRIADAFYKGRSGVDLLDYEMYESTNGPGYDCKIPVNEESATEDMFCMFEVLELDLFLHELVFEYNAPPGMCNFIEFQPHWHYNRESGYGPTLIYSSSFQTPDGKSHGKFCSTCDDDAYRYCPAPGANEQQIEDGLICASGIFKERGCKEESDPSFTKIRCGDCDIDYCKEKVEQVCSFTKNEVNCCLGEYKQRNVRTQASTEGNKWGGDLKNCIGGLGRTSWDKYSQDGMPLPIITEAKDGLRQRYNIPPVIEELDKTFKRDDSRDRFHSMVTANYWEGIKENTGRPDFYKPSLKEDADIDPGYPYITFSCLDQAYEVKHKIHLVIREWNSLEEFRDFKDSQGDSGDPDVVGASGSDCDYYENENDRSLKDTECNDLKDVDDWIDRLSRDDDNDHPKLEYKDDNSSAEEGSEPVEGS